MNNITIIGGGSASLFFASFLDERLFNVNIYEQKKSGLGRKFLVAGDGGFNLTHSEKITNFIERYTPSPFLQNSLHFFDNQHFRNWLNEIGIPTYIGSSNRVYPTKGIKPIEVLNAIQSVLNRKNTSIHYNKTFTGWDSSNNPIFNNEEVINSNYCVFALGGASWKITGSDGNWAKAFKEKGIKTTQFEASNCAYRVNWDPQFIQTNEGSPLKNIAIKSGDKVQKGEVVITKFGLEGNAIYALSPEIRLQLRKTNEAEISLDLKPMLSEEKVKNLLLKQSTNITQNLKKHLKLSSTQIQLLKSMISKDDFMNLEKLTFAIKNLTIKIQEAAPIDEAISTFGGVSLNEVNENFELLKVPNQFCIGEMLNWDAPTGGYLLQACASMGAYLANHLNKHQI